MSTELSEEEEREFQARYRELAKTLNLDPDPDNPLHFYDYRAAYKAGKLGVGPDKHFPSEFKRIGHPNLIVDGVDTRTGKKASEELVRQNDEAGRTPQIESPVGIFEFLFGGGAPQ